jgi:hypothetical protein
MRSSGDLLGSYTWAFLVGVNFGLWQHSASAGLFAWAFSIVLLTPWRKS